MPSPGPLEYIIIALIAVLIVLPIVVLVMVARGYSPFGGTAVPARDPAMDVLRERFARGEIDETEFQRLRSALQGH